MKLYYIPALLFSLTFISCKENPKEEKATDKTPLNIRKAEWLIGDWGSSSKDGDMTEHWHRVNDSVFKGESYIITAKDTLFAEVMVLDDVAGKMAFTASVPGQNEEKPVRFEMTAITDKEVTFENPAHDFPTKIVYTNPTPDSLVAIIYGKKDGKAISETFKMKRLQ